ncbi:putative transcription repressor PLATZ family [Helianthus annuus]|nr:putative transcription repressor PLATZ family [Helianthus annuus]KAJ0637850.1 putative transcription repressor PLATZ family [Helianthus annuus]KAJ0828353.1 putative transcription repressor PLATZ family [Helianthus annuus]
MIQKCKWIVNLLESKFFGACIDHGSMAKSEKNVFCMDCNLCLCGHCVSGFKPRCHHHHHRRLQIFRYVYHDVVRIQDIQKHLDCSDIQVSLSSYLLHHFLYIIFMIQLSYNKWRSLRFLTGVENVYIQKFL